jgi:ubiquinone/menaquinone biosynthesis C-methylase UbiE
MKMILRDFYKLQIQFSDSEVHDAVLNHIKKRRITAERMLDVGCGNGSLALRLSNILGSKETYGIDISQKVIDEARKKGLKVYNVDINVDRLPFPDNHFDLVTADRIN